MLGGVIGPTPGASHKSFERRAIDDGAATLFTHLLQFKFHATPNATEIDAGHAAKIFTGLICGFRESMASG